MFFFFFLTHASADGPFGLLLPDSDCEQCGHEPHPRYAVPPLPLQGLMLPTFSVFLSLLPSFSLPLSPSLVYKGSEVSSEHQFLKQAAM